MSKCPTGCKRPVQPGHLMCRVCWFKVPLPLRRGVWGTWRRWQRSTGDAELFQAYEQAREAAIASVP